MEAAFDLRETPFSSDDLELARRTWAWLDETYRLDWLAHPRGVLGGDWNADTTQSACRLIHTAWVLHSLAANVTEKSVPVLRRKVRALLDVKPSRVPMEVPRQFDELMTELEFTALVSQLASPVALEPFVRPDAKEHEAEESPDFALRLPDGDVAFEVTVLYVGQLDAWERKVREVRDVLRAKIARRGVFRDVSITVPLTFTPAEGLEISRRATTEAIVKEERGRIVIPMKAGDATVEWRPMPVFSDASEAQNVDREVGGFAVTTGELGSGGSVRWRPAFDVSEIERRALASLRNTLRRKADQFPGGTAYVLVLKAGHHRIPPEGLLNLTNRRIWPNELYTWITGMMIYRPPMQGCERSPHPWGAITFNPNADVQAGSSLDALFRGEATFHS